MDVSIRAKLLCGYWA